MLPASRDRDRNGPYFAMVTAFCAASSCERSAVPAGILLELRMKVARSVACALFRLPGELAGIESLIFVTRSETGVLSQKPRKSAPASCGAPPPLKSAEWHEAHCSLYRASPRLAWAAL